MAADDAKLTEPLGVWERREGVQILDVREPWEWEAGHIEGAVHIPLNALLAGRMEGLERDRPVVAVCKTGNRSEVAALMLRARGFDAYNLESGSEAWVEAGLPLVTDEGTPGRVA